MAEGTSRAQQDWVGNSRSYWLAWGLPTAAMVGAILVDPPVKTIIWSISLIWMGAACLANAARCGRLHCYVTGPFFLIMAVVVLLHGFDAVPLGPNGWTWIAVTIFVGGFGSLWLLPEFIWGKFRS